MLLSKRLVLPLQVNFNMREKVIHDFDCLKWTIKKSDHSGTMTQICTFICSKARGLGLFLPLNLCFKWEKMYLKWPFRRRLKNLDKACKQKFKFGKEDQIYDRKGKNSLVCKSSREKLEGHVTALTAVVIGLQIISVRHWWIARLREKRMTKQ